MFTLEMLGAIVFVFSYITIKIFIKERMLKGQSILLIKRAILFPF